MGAVGFFDRLANELVSGFTPPDPDLDFDNLGALKMSVRNTPAFFPVGRPGQKGKNADAAPRSAAKSRGWKGLSLPQSGRAKRLSC